MDSVDPRLAAPGGIAEKLKGIRSAARLSGKDLSSMLGWAPSKVSRIENARQMPSEEDLVAWATACASPEALTDLQRLLADVQTQHSDWKRRLQQGQTPVQQSYLKLERESAAIYMFEMTYVPGLLQTPEYARRVLALSAEILGSAIDDVDAAVAARMQRQQVLYAPNKKFEFLIGEPALRWLFCSKETMLVQLDRLQTVIGMPHVRFGILPLGVDLGTAPRNSFQIFENLIAVETFAGETFYQGEYITTFQNALSTLWKSAVEADDARSLIAQIASDLRRG